MNWENSIWNYHKLGLIIAFFVFFLVCPPIWNFINRYNYSPWWAAVTVAILTWGFTFLIIHGYTNKKDNHEIIIDS